MPRAERWSQLKIGLLVAVAITTVVAAVLRFARVGALHGPTSHIYMVTNRAVGVIDGTEVWLAGQKVGLVTDVGFRSASSDTTERVAIGMDILSDYMHLIRKNSDVQIRPGGNLIGAPVIFITVGTGNTARVAAGDTLRALEQVERRPGVADISSLGDSVDAISRELGQIQAELDTTAGEVSTLSSRTTAQIAAVRRAIHQFSQRATRSNGSLALVVRDSARLRRAVTHVAAVADSIHRAAASGSGSIGRFRRDSTLLRYAQGVLGSVDSLRSSLDRYSTNPAHGSSALSTELLRVHVQLDSLIQDAKRNPSRYIAL